MPRFPNIFSSSGPSSLTSSARSSTTSLSHLSTEDQLNDALDGCSYILRDDMETAESRLSAHNSSFHKLGYATAGTMCAALGFESETMADASARLADAASTAAKDAASAQRDSRGSKSAIYEPGTEYRICQAEAHIMGAVMGILSESVTEALKGFYNVRKAYMTLEGVVERERRYARVHAGEGAGGGVESVRGSKDMSRPTSVAGGSLLQNVETVQPVKDEVGDEDDSDDDFVDAPQHIVGPGNLGYLGHIVDSTSPKDSNKGSSTTASVARLSLDNKSTNTTPATDTTTSSPDESDILPRHLITNPMDAYIHSSTYLFFGLLQLMLSLIPPTMSRLLSIIGFRGSRTLGLSLLWRASSFSNLNGAMAGNILLSYYTGLVAYLDILPASGPGALPIQRCQQLIREMRQRYPESTLVLLCEVRMLTTERQLEKAVEMIQGAEESKLKQLRALQCFEMSLNCMYAHRWQECADGFERCITMNNWSHGLYIYIAAICHVELYRSAAYSSPPNPTQAAHHASKATDLLHRIPENTGKKRFMSKQLPFDLFVNRKYAKWTSLSKTHGLPLIDAVGVSPVEEMIYFWGGYARMGVGHLEESLERLGWSDGTPFPTDYISGGTKPGATNSTRKAGKLQPNPHWSKEEKDERAMLSTLRATVLRHLGHLDAAQTLLRMEVLERYSYISDIKPIKNADAWPLPVAHYEMAVCYWLRSREGREGARPLDGTSLESGNSGVSNDEALRLCSKWLEGVGGAAESWELEGRFGQRISTGRETLRELGVGPVA